MNNFYVEPAYVNAAAKDFRIVPGTPCAPLVVDPGVGPPGGGPGKRAARKALAAEQPSLGADRRALRPVGQPHSGDIGQARPDSGAAGQPLDPRAQRTPAGGHDFRAVVRLRLRRLPSTRLVLGAARLPRKARALRLRAHVPGLGSSASVRVRIRR